MTKDLDALAAEIETGLEGVTPGPWSAFNMVHAERGDQMTPEEIGEYVKNNVIKSIESGGCADRFLFISTPEEGAPDICHVGNGPRGPANASHIARCSPDNMRALLAERKQMKAALEWQPIETAPREYEIIWVGNENNTRLAFWKSGPENYTSLSSDIPDGGWIDYSKAESYQNVTSVQFMPTHWMHRPVPPALTQEGEG